MTAIAFIAQHLVNDDRSLQAWIYVCGHCVMPQKEFGKDLISPLVYRMAALLRWTLLHMWVSNIIYLY